MSILEAPAWFVLFIAIQWNWISKTIEIGDIFAIYSSCIALLTELWKNGLKK